MGEFLPFSILIFYIQKNILGAIKISIGYDENLNDKRKAGVLYVCGSSSIVATLQNKPSGLSVAFGMFVVPTPSEPTYCVQFLISEMAVIYKRKCDNNIFSEWESI